MRLIANWRRVMLRAWSSRLSALAALFVFLDAALPLLDGVLPIPRRSFALLAGLAAAGAFIARIVTQDSLKGEDR